MSGYLTLISLIFLQTLGVMYADDYAEKAVQENGIWLAEVGGKPIALTRIERNDQEETTSDFVVKDATPFPKIARRGYAGEEFFLKASKSVPRIGRRNDDSKAYPKRSTDKDPASPDEYWPWLQYNGHVDSAKKEIDFPFGCQQLDAKTIFLVDLYNFVCNDQFYCCATTKRSLSA
ncbi:uncharacterized protein LOC126897531 [Daktulosphaira vitifoliae]|uniref:uncharacterized protein LOC126897531 n=1 Tax=Daktulosphaira vitifoliae TaxID=58002 RepID=UPI0021A9C9A2|nr:uncharacterized protein LOC126897531 [Daktulosphaira vitifoliae]